MKLYITKFVALIATVLLGSTMFAQSTYVPFDVHSTVWGGMFAPQSPEAMALTRYGDHTPNLYYGSASFSIPIYEWKDNLFDIPISLEYNSGGFRPGAACSPVGNDWALRFGGVITREVRGIPDETWHEGYSASSVFYANPSGSDDPMSDYIFPNPNYRNLPDPYEGYALRGFANRYYSNSSSYVSSTQKYIYTGKLQDEFVCGSVLSSDSSILVENEPDVFHFSMPGGSGSFILQPNHSVRFINCSVPSGELSVVFSFTPSQQGTGSSFTITDGHGVKYLFADTETTDCFDALHGNDEGGAAVSCWRLTSITHPSGKTVSFTYTERVVSNVSPVVTADHLTISDGSGPGSGHPVYNQWIDDPDYFDTSLIYNAVYEKHLTGVNFAGRGSASLTWDNSGRLASICIHNADSDLLKECDLSYYIPYNTNGARHSTLAFLSSVFLSGEGVYGMTYDSANDNCQFPYNSGGTNNDLWYTDAFGYYSNVSLKALFNYNYQSLSALAAYIDNQRVPNLARTRMGMLTAVTYPAGGRSTFTYELNTWSRKNDGTQALNPNNPATGGVRVSRIDTFDESNSQTRCRRYYYTDPNGYSSGVLLQYPQIYFKYHFTSNTSGVVLKVEREAVSTTSCLGFSKDSHIEYLRVVETVSRTASSPVVSRTIHTFNSASSVNDNSCETEYLHDCAVNQTEFTFTNDGTVLTEWQDHGVSVFAGKPAQVVRDRISNSDPLSVTSNSYDTYNDYAGASCSGKMIHFGKLRERVYNTISPYMSSTTVTETAADGSSSSVTTTVTVDSRGRTASVSRPDSYGNSLMTAYSYHTTLPGLLTQVTVTRGGNAVSATKYDYDCENSSTSWYVPSAVSTRLINGSSFGDWRIERTFSSWDAWGNPGTVTDAAGRTTTWTWGYSGLHPVSCQFTAPSGAVAQQSWTWMPMVGPTSATDISGRTVYYSYDSSCRLTGVSNVAGSVVSYDYYFPGTGDSRTYSDRTYIATTNYCAGGTGTDVAYYDGLGRLRQTVMIQASGRYNTDIIAPVWYDELGRKPIEEYPYPKASNWGTLRSDWSYDQRDYYENDAGYAGGDDYLFGVAHTYEHGAGGRVLTTTLPGYEYYAEYGSEYSYYFNSSGTFSCVMTTDGDGKTSSVWTDREGHVVEEDRGGSLSTTYNYDSRGNLVSVTQPKGTSFSYSYDALGRQTMKSTPDSGAELFVYDSAGRVVLSQDGNLRDQSRWILNTWDDFDCLVRSQLIYTTLSQSTLQSYFPVSGSGTLPASAYTVIGTIAEYGYMRSNGATVTVPSSLAFAADGTASGADLGSSLNLKIYEKLLCLPEDDSNASTYASQPYVERAFFHDVLGRELQTVEKNVLGGITRVSTELDQDGNPVSVTETVSLSVNDNNPKVKHTEYDYDSRGRLTGETVQIGGSTISSTTMTYDALGRPSTISGNGLQQTQTYNFQGWIDSIQATSGGSNIFNEYLRYAESVHATPLHTGIITEIEWQHGNSTPSTYAFSYDNAKRLTGSARYSGNALDNSWTERDIAYDANGNITAIKRYGSSSSTPIDNLSISYSGNTLTYVGNSAFSHDSSGNLVSDPLRGLTFAYNILGQPSCISGATDDALYTYLADGTKSKVEADAGDDAYVYMGSMVFTYANGAWVFDSTPFAGGRIRKSGSSYVADRYATDHLGSVRAIVRNSQVIERNDYYPYGGRHANSALTTDATNRWRFSAKEIQTVSNVNLLDFGARMYDDRLCRWTTQDPMAEKYYGFSPYCYCAGEPVGMVDDDGQKLYFAQGSSEEFKKNFADAVKIMNAKGTSYNLAAIEASSVTFLIQESTENNYNPISKVISWNPSRVLESDKGLLISPLTLLAHEASHASAHADAILNNSEDSFLQSTKTPDEKYDNVEEKRVVTGDEQVAAKKHGEITNNQITRTEHHGYSVRCIKGSMQEKLNYVVNNNVALPF